MHVSVNETGGGLGGLVKLGTTPQVGEGFHAQYVQGIGSFRTFDEFARFTYGSDRWQVSTRTVYSSSPNDYKYTNHDKKINIYDEEKNIIGQYHPRNATDRVRSRTAPVAGGILQHPERRPFRVERMVYQLQPGTADAHDRLRR